MKLNEIIKQMNDKILNCNVEEEIDDILDDIKTHLFQNFDLIEDAYYHDTNDNIDKDLLIDKFNIAEKNHYGIIGMAYKNEYGMVANNFVPYGVVGLIIKNNISIYNITEIISLIIQTRNSLIIECNTFSTTMLVLIELINQILEETERFNKIYMINENIEKIDDDTNVDLILYIGQKDAFNKLNNPCLKKYFGIGNYELYIDEELDNDLIEEAKKQNVKIIKDLSFEELNIAGSNYATSLLSSNTKMIRLFINKVKSRFLLINMLPTLEDRISISPSDLLYEKATIIYQKDDSK